MTRFCHDLERHRLEVNWYSGQYRLAHVNSKANTHLGPPFALPVGRLQAAIPLLLRCQHGELIQ